MAPSLRIRSPDTVIIVDDPTLGDLPNAAEAHGRNNPDYPAADTYKHNLDFNPQNDNKTRNESSCPALILTVVSIFIVLVFAAFV